MTYRAVLTPDDFATTIVSPEVRAILAYGGPVAEKFAAFDHVAPLRVQAASALPARYTLGVAVDELALETPDKTDLAVGWLNPETRLYEELDSDVRDIGQGERIYFAPPAAVAAATLNESCALFWGGLGRVTKTNRDNIYLLWDECNTKAGWNDYYGTFASAGGRFTEIAGNLLDRTLKDSELPTPNVTVYGLVNRRLMNYACIAMRSDITGNGNTWILGIYTWPAQGLFRQYWIDNTNPVAFRGSVPFVANVNTDYIIKCKMVGNNFEGWVAEAGTPIAGAAMINWINAQANNARYAGFATVNSPTTEYDNLYVLHAVTNDPTVSLGDVVDIKGLVAGRLSR